jgi:hypothetical protein
MAAITKLAIYACIVFDQTAEEPDHIRETIQISQHLWLKHPAALPETNGNTFGSAADGARHFIGR